VSNAVLNTGALRRLAHAPGVRQWERRAVRIGAQLAQMLLRPVAGVLLMDGAAAGAMLWLGLLLQPRLAIAGLFGLLMGEAFRRAMRVEEATGFEGSVKANAFLAAIAMAWLTRHAGIPLLAEIALVIAASGMASILAAAIKGALGPSPLPALAWAYCIVAGAFLAIFPEWALRSVLDMPWGGPPAGLLDWGVALLRALGAVLFQPSPLVGALVALALLLWSPIGFACGVIGWVAGVATAAGFLRLGETYYWLPASYNFFIAGMALGAVQYLPSRAGLLVAACAGGFASVVALTLQVVLEGSSAAYLPIAAGVTVWTGIGALHAASRRGRVRRNPAPSLPPEDAWRCDAYPAARWGYGETLLAVPMGGALEVTQGFGGRLSHAGAWRHALDVQRPAEEAGMRAPLQGAPVHAPAPGVVETLRGDVADNPPGRSNFADNWGNHVVLRLDQGYWALLGHLQQGSLAVFAGERVNAGAMLGLAGNSGRSPAPHLHMQAQIGPLPGAPTRAFRLANYLTAEAPGEPFLRWHAAAVPKKGTVLAVALPNPALRALLTGMVPGRALWSAAVTGQVPRAFAPGDARAQEIALVLDEAGQLLATAETGALSWRFDADAWRLVSASPRLPSLLALMAMALPSIPYAAVPGMQWDDISPLPWQGPVWARRWLAPLLSDPFLGLACCCTAVPADEKGALEMQVAPIPSEDNSLPRSITTKIEPLRGAVELTAHFERGAVAWSLVSFVPTLPLRTE